MILLIDLIRLFYQLRGSRLKLLQELFNLLHFFYPPIRKCYTYNSAFPSLSQIVEKLIEMDRVPVTLLTGFLGSGKSTL